MRRVNQIRLKSNPTVKELIDAMAGCGVLGAGRLARGVKALRLMLTHDEYTTFLTLAGPAIPGGLRSVISNLVRRGLVDAVVSSGGNLTHDIMEAYGLRHFQGETPADDVRLSRGGLARIGDLYVSLASFKRLEKIVYSLLEEAREKLGGRFAVYRLLDFFGGRLKARDEGSLLASAHSQGVPVFCPGIFDSMLGLHVWTYSQLHRLEVDMLADMDRMAELVFGAKKLGAIILGGGLPKHFALGASTLKGGVDAAVQLTMDRPEGGSLSGALLEEAIGWRKAKVKAKPSLVTVVGDYTILLPLMVAAAVPEAVGG